jgi:hypothetical protein
VDPQPSHVTTFIGIVHPQAGAWYFDEPIVARRDDETITMIVRGSAFQVRVLTPAVGTEIDETWVDQTWLRASATVHGALDALGFHLGAALDIQMVSGTVNDRGFIFPTLLRPYFGTVAGSRVDGAELQKYVPHAIDNANLRYALGDVRQALQLDDDSAFYCYRAIESLRQHFVEGDEEDRAVRVESWRGLRDALGVTEADIRAIGDAAKSRRHGGKDQLELAKRVEFLTTTRQMIARFVDLLPTLAVGDIPIAEA